MLYSSTIILCEHWVNIDLDDNEIISSTNNNVTTTKWPEPSSQGTRLTSSGGVNVKSLSLRQCVLTLNQLLVHEALLK